MNVIQKSGTGAIDRIRKTSADKMTDRDLSFEVGRTSREVLRKLLVVCGKVGKENTALYKNKARLAYAGGENVKLRGIRLGGLG